MEYMQYLTNNIMVMYIRAARRCQKCLALNLGNTTASLLLPLLLLLQHNLFFACHCVRPSFKEIKNPDIKINIDIGTDPNIFHPT